MISADANDSRSTSTSSFPSNLGIVAAGGTLVDSKSIVGHIHSASGTGTLAAHPAAPSSGDRSRNGISAGANLIQAVASPLLRQAGGGNATAAGNLGNAFNPGIASGSLSLGRSEDGDQSGAEDGGRRLPRNHRFLLRMALALHAYGSIAPRTEFLVERLAERLGVDLHIAVFPALLLLSFNKTAGDDTDW